MPPKRPRSATATMSPSTKKIIVEPEYRKLSECTIRRIRGSIPDDVKLLKFQIDAAPNHEMAEKLQKLIFNVKDENKLGILIGVKNYKANRNIPNHAISVYKWGNVLYCFDPWGVDRVKISNAIFKIIKEITNCDRIQIYNGTNLQTYNTFGVCVGLSSNFIIIMANQKAHIKQRYAITIKRMLLQQNFNNIVSNLQARTYAIPKSKTLKSLTPMNIN